MSDIRNKISARLKTCRAASGLTFAEAAQRLSIITGSKVIPSRYGNWELAINTPPLDQLIALGELYGKPPAWLAGLTDDDGTAPEVGLYTVPQVSTVNTANGPINLGDDSFAARVTFLEEIKLDRTKMLLVIAPDDSMSGVIEEGDRVWIDRAATRVTRDDLFALMIGERLWLRWIRQELDGTFTLQAEARDRYPDQKVSAEQLAGLHILGRVKLITHIR
ncbi:TPA: XRE family transcriptional regulator [Pseudomonas aeruginosa]|uniref:XRE family transcriptional regulator n=2 Tax=Pseudomonas aeruginosa TaxID=287 RepID=UPI00053D6E41|nr:S24 family peptidase [Pseudomonas aeruginosa]EIU5460351.1 hypothetical protein [Pseudomonas aeruginosa]EIU5543734.1 hypothetical protein [Pseudomonas aeruginosa]EKW4494324.1 hypothetical protein [Pseudomonas aeruginosa]EKY0500338.1 hypothetical protein [Pseudomonas aeruginosa]EKY1849420.1 hypothetical protein [Pseudomonas aeruginosa]